MGSPKALLHVGGRSLLGRALCAAGERRTAVVVSSAVAAAYGSLPEHARFVCNDEPERGMSHSLALANAALGVPETALVVLLVDTPLVDNRLVERVERALGDADVAYPVRAGVPGHPVVFGPRARARIAQLAPGDTLRRLRDDPALRSVTVPVDEEAPYVDLDSPHDVERLRGA